ncbi:MAG TPA: hypothetical protein VMU61_10915 [Candidatus Aquilonibacter sp.]|nr:hypothetical protein [Candidatus Aquilonibacter sp.]
MPPALHAASRTAPAKSSGLGTGYASALATADRFLQAWQTGDIENGIGMLTNRAKGRISREQLEAFFSGSTPAAYEIARGKSLSRGRYEFPVVLMGSSSSAASAKGSHSHRRFSNLVVLHTGNDDWAIDKLP